MFLPITLYKLHLYTMNILSNSQLLSQEATSAATTSRVGSQIDGVWSTSTHFELCMYIYAVLSGYPDLVYTREPFKETRSPIVCPYPINYLH